MMQTVDPIHKNSKVVGICIQASQLDLSHFIHNGDADNIVSSPITEVTYVGDESHDSPSSNTHVVHLQLRGYPKKSKRRSNYG